MQFPKRQSVQDLRDLLRFMDYYRRFTRNYAKTTTSFLELLTKDKKWKWKSRYQNAFIDVRNLFKNNQPKEHMCYKQMLAILQLEVCYCSEMRMENTQSLRMLMEPLKVPEKVISLQRKKYWSYCTPGINLDIIYAEQVSKYLLKSKLNNARLTRWILIIQENSFTIN